MTAVLGPITPEPLAKADGPHDRADVGELRVLFHRLNNQLGIILAHAELLEARTLDAPSRARAQQVIASVVDALGTAREIREKTTS